MVGDTDEKAFKKIVLLTSYEFSLYNQKQAIWFFSIPPPVTKSAGDELAGIKKKCLRERQPALFQPDGNRKIP